MTTNQNSIPNNLDKNQTNTTTDNMSTIGFNSLNPLVQNLQFGTNVNSIADNPQFYDNTLNYQISQQLNSLGSNLNFGNTNLGYPQQTQTYQSPFDQNTLRYNQLSSINTSSILNGNIRNTPNLNSLNNLA